MQINADQALSNEEPSPYIFELTSTNIDNITKIISRKYRNRLISITAPVKSYFLTTNDNFFYYYLPYLPLSEY